MLCPVIYISIIFAYSMFNSVLVCHRSDAEDCSHDGLSYVLFWGAYGQVVMVFEDPVTPQIFYVL